MTSELTKRLLRPFRPLLRRAGYAAADLEALEEHPAEVLETHALVQRLTDDPDTRIETAVRFHREARVAKKEMLAARKQAEAEREQLERTRTAAGELQGILEGLLNQDRVLGRLEQVVWHEHRRPTALCRLGNQLMELQIHPNVDPEGLLGLRSWDHICVHAKEMIVTGSLTQPDFFHRAQAEVVEYKGWFNRERRQVRVARQGNEETIVNLAPEIDAETLQAPASLVLQGDDPRWALAVLPTDEIESRFEYPVANIETRLEDLAGLDVVVEPLVRDILLRLVHPELRQRFDLTPLRGVLLYSYAPGMGKTALMRAMARWLHELGQELDFDVVLYVVKPNELKIVWHGGDAKLVREDLCGAIRARQARQRVRPLFQFVVLDEVDSLGARAGGDDAVGPTSSAGNDAVQALLAEMDGMEQAAGASDLDPDRPASHVVFCGLTNRPDMVDAALKRPGRFGDLVLEMPTATMDTGVRILGVYARQLPWWIDGRVHTDVSAHELESRILRPALASVFDVPVLRYATDGRGSESVTAGRVLASVHLMEAMNSAKKAAAMRELEGVGVPAVGFLDVVEGLLAQAVTAAAALEADRGMLRRQLRVKKPVTRVDLVPREELGDHVFVVPDEGLGVSLGPDARAVNGHPDGQANGHMNGAARALTNGRAHGPQNGQTNGRARGQTPENGHAS